MDGHDHLYSYADAEQGALLVALVLILAFMAAEVVVAAAGVMGVAGR